VEFRAFGKPTAQIYTVSVVFLKKLSAQRFLTTALNPRHIHASPTTRRRSFYLAVTSLPGFPSRCHFTLLELFGPHGLKDPKKASRKFATAASNLCIRQVIKSGLGANVSAAPIRNILGKSKTA
jgi:hypothetical protein